MKFYIIATIFVHGLMTFIWRGKEWVNLTFKMIWLMLLLWGIYILMKM